MAVALKNLPDIEPDTPAYTDRLIAWHNQRLWYVACGLGGLLALSFAINLKHEYQPPPPPYVLEVNSQGQPVGQVLPILSVQAIPDASALARQILRECATRDEFLPRWLEAQNVSSLAERQAANGR